jgi:hypothetical protein
LTGGGALEGLSPAGGEKKGEDYTAKNRLVKPGGGHFDDYNG